jgi:hypothetical protein
MALAAAGAHIVAPLVPGGSLRLALAVAAFGPAGTLPQEERAPAEV